MIFFDNQFMVFQKTDEPLELQQAKAQRFVQTVLYLGAQFRGEVPNATS